MATLYATADQVYRQSIRLDPLKVALTLLLIVPFAIGWTARIVWVLLALLWTGVGEGWKAATVQIEARQAAARSG